MAADAEMQRTQLSEQRRKVDFDTYDITVDELVRRVAMRRIEVAPAYQRQFRWDDIRQSRLIESLLLGIPVPPLFMATNVDDLRGSHWEVVDGLQRLLTLTNFLGDDSTRKVARVTGERLRLTGLEKLDNLNGVDSTGLPLDIRTGLEDRPIKVIVLNDKSDLQVRFDLFERLNTGGVRLTDHEVRECVFMGEFIDLVDELAKRPSFRTVVRLPRGRMNDGTAEDYALRFFAFHERYRSFEHSVKDFLNDFCVAATKEPKLTERRQVFERTFDYLAQAFPDGMKSRKGATPVNLYEGVAVGAALALDIKPDLAQATDIAWIFSDEMRAVTTGATNSRVRVAKRIETSRDRFLAGT